MCALEPCKYIYIFAPEIPSIEKELNKMYICLHVPYLVYHLIKKKMNEKGKQKKKKKTHTTQVDGLEKGK